MICWLTIRRNLYERDSYYPRNLGQAKSIVNQKPETPAKHCLKGVFC